MGSITKSWKTTVAGVVMILTAVGNAVMEFANGGIAAIRWEVLIASVVGGVGLIMAKDAGVTNSPTPGPAVKVSPGG